MKVKKEESEKRHTHSYKCLDEVYLNACERAKKEGTSLAEKIEKFVTLYSKNKKL